MDFVHLHLHSEYSLLDGASRISDIPKAAKAAGQSAVAITDHGNMFGAVEFFNACKKEGVKPIIGCEVYVAPSSRFDRPERGGRPYNHLILLCKNDQGYRNLIKLVSLGFTEGFYLRPRIDLELLAAHSEGLICLSACMVGYIPQAILRGDFDDALAYANKLDAIFGRGNFYLEIQDHSLEEDRVINAGIARLSKETGIPVVATNDVHYIRREDSETQAVLMAIQTGKTIEESRLEGFATDEFYFKSADEMSALFDGFEGAIENTVKIADACDFEFDFSTHVFPKVTLDSPLSPEEYLKNLAYEGLESRATSGDITFETHPRSEYEDRIEYELSTICEMGFAEYFIIVWDFVGFAKRSDIPVGPGRGSGAGSLVAYLIGITDVDPVDYDLLFEAFLNKERVSMPDFDIDFCYFRRDEVYEYVKRKYGDDYVSKIITFGTLAARAAVRDVGRALGMPYAEVDVVAKAIPRELGITLDKAMKTRELKDLYNGSDKVRRLIDLSRAVEGMPRNVSVHAAGVVICDKPINQYVPLAVSGDVTVTQFDMKSVSSLGLLKFDFLGLRYLTIIDNCAKSVAAFVPGFDIRKIPLDDKKTYNLISRGESVGCFQIERSGMRAMLSNMKPSCIRDLMVAIALYRPGPAQFIDRFIENRRRGTWPPYPIPSLAEILDPTFGCIVYQDQVMEIFRVVAGYTYGKADVVRRAISKKKRDVIESERANFIEGSVAAGSRREDAEALFEDMIGFSDYGFKKAHAAAYGILSYQTAYLKANYPAHYFTALISSVKDRLDKVAEYLNDAAKYRIKLLPPDINESEANFTVSSDGNIRYGLIALKNVGVNFVDALCKERRKRSFSSFDEFISRMSDRDLNKKQIESMIKAGCFDSLGVGRSTLLASYEDMLDTLSRRRHANVEGQLDMFASADAEGQFSYEYKNLPELDLKTRLAFEKEVMEMYVTAHPLDAYADEVAATPHAPVSEIIDIERDLTKYPERSEVTVCGIVSEITRKKKPSGDMAFIKLEDKTGTVEVILFNRIYLASAIYLRVDSALTVTGEITTQDDEPAKIIAHSVVPVGAKPQERGDRSVPAPEKSQTPVPSRVFLKVSSLDSPEWKRANAVISIFSGQTAVVVYEEKTKKYSALTNKSVSADDFVLAELRGILGDDGVVIK